MEFYQKAAIIDELRDLADISKKDVDLLKKLVAEPPVRTYFLRGLKNPQWFFHLKTMEMFSNPPKLTSQGGSIAFRGWDVIDYLLEMAQVYPHEVVDIVKSIPADNANVIWGCVKIGLRLPPDQTAELVPQVLEWCTTPYLSSTNFGVDIGGWIAHLVRGGEIEAASLLLESLTTPKIRVDNYRQPDEAALIDRPQAMPPIETYAFEDLLQKHMTPLFEEVPFIVARILEGALAKSIQIEQLGRKDDDYSYLWRPAIEDHSQNWGFREIKDLLTVGLRDVIQYCANSDAESAKGYCAYLLNKEYSVFRRLAIHTTRVNAKLFTEYGKSILLDPDRYHDRPIHHEFLLLLEEWFSDLNEFQKDQVLDWLFNHPDKDAIDDHARPEIREKQRLYWSVSRLWLIKAHLVGEAKQAFEKMLAEVEPIEHPTFLSYHEQLVGERSPVTKEEIAELQPVAVIELLRTFKPKQGFREPTPSGLARTFVEDIKTRPEDYLELSNEFLKGMKPAYVWAFVEALAETWRVKTQLNWGLTLNLFANIMKVPDLPKDETQEFEENYSSVRRRIADLMGEVLRHQLPSHLPFDFRDQAWEIISFLCHDPEPNEAYERELGGSNMNPPTLCINTIRGKAMHALINYSLWYAHFSKELASVQGRTDRFDPRAKALLTEKLDKKNDPSPSIHSVFGQFLPNLQYLDRAWLIQHLREIFPVEPIFWKASWGSYISFCGVYTSLYSLLKEQYERAIALLPKGSVFEGTTTGPPEQGLAEHLMVLYLNGFESLDRGSKILSFFMNANDHQKAMAIRFIGDRAIREKLFTKPEIWSRSTALWEARLNATLKVGEDRPHEEEFAAYLGWSRAYQDPLPKMYDLLNITLKNCRPKSHVNDLLAYIAAQAKGAEGEAVNLLAQCMTSVGPEVLNWAHEKVGEIIAVVSNSDDFTVRKRSNELINQFGEWGVYEYRDLLRPSSGTR